MSNTEEYNNRNNFLFDDDIFQWVTQTCSEIDIPSSPNGSRTYDLPITSSDALPLSYRRLVGAKAIKLGSSFSSSKYRSWSILGDN